MASWSFAGNLQGPAGGGQGVCAPSLYVLPFATTALLDGSKVGAGLSMTADGVLSAAVDVSCPMSY